MSAGGIASGIGGGMQFGSTVGGAYAQAQAIKSQAAYQSQQMQFNARIARMQEEAALRRGEQDVARHKVQTRQLVGSQRASMAAQGIDIESGSARDVQRDSLIQSERDVLTIRNNAWMEAWGFKAQALQYQLSGEMAQATAQTQARGTLVAGGLKAAGDGASSYGAYKTRNTDTDTIATGGSSRSYNSRYGNRPTEY